MESRIGSCPLGAKCEEIKEIDGIQVKFVCPWYVKVQGKNPQTEEFIDDWRCAIAWMPILQIEHSLHERQTGAAVESFRNEMTKQNDRLLGATGVKRLKDG